MTAIEETPFDKVAASYDVLWSETPIGKAQRTAVWNHIDPLFKPGDFVLDLGCGTGIDALHLLSRGVFVHGIDSSPRMVELARQRGVEAYCFPIEGLERLDLRLDGVISNFGALNCLPSLTSLAATLGRLVRSSGYVTLCFLNRICIWEIAFYLVRKPSKAFRRFKGHTNASVGITVFYKSSHNIISAFRSKFRFVNSYGIGLSVPPSYVTFLNGLTIEQLSMIDGRLAHRLLLRSLADHRLYVFRRL